MGIFRKFSLPFAISKKYEMLPEAKRSICTPMPGTKTLATFELKVGEPRYLGDIPEATIKFYPLD